ncbi:pimeloyl-ACP methyl ester carboxylesterase [Kribbella amoyensis]|uniref:Pimeloyl-ACP methyl ester carboxylesterase n=1 Tax=Kribbella amoyensis TaxID=996641 RepID=A0A561BQD5_9ACTN|nr:alpha/beta hydrolase [Kribbella amoyensis]TWD81070.1 pimeloyl-ACP methyl ester carboxylesterase [Kribbella amoyensis]
MTQAQRRTVEVSGAKISLLEWVPEEPAGPTVLLLHGGGADSAELSWGGVGAALSDEGFRVVAPDHPGFGQSPRASRPLTQEYLVRYVGGLVDELDLDDYVIGGLSLGGGLTLGHLLDRPARARGAVLLGSYGIMPRLRDGVLGGAQHFATYLLLRSGLLAAMTRSYARSPAAMERGLRAIVRNQAGRTPELVRAVIAEAASGDGMSVFTEWQHDQVLWNRLRTDYTSSLPEIQTPTLLVHGDHDTGVPLARARAAAGLLPQAELVPVAGAGHWVQRDRPDVVVPALVDFLRGLG